MAEETKETQENVQTTAVAKEQKTTEDLRLRCEELFALLAKPELTADEKAKVSGIVKESPVLLLQKEFTEKFEMPALLQGYQAGTDVKDLIAQSSKANALVKQVLDNLKEINLEEKGKTAAAYMLDSAYLPTGELVGTQLAKNIYFMKTAPKDKEHQFYEDAAQNEALRNAIDTHFGDSAVLYKMLYENPEGYCANKNSFNAANQKVEDLMKKCEEASDTKIESLATREFMRHPDPAATEKKRGELTVDELRMKRYRGTLTVGEKELLDKKEQEDKKEVPFEKMHDPQYGGSDHKKGEAFSDGDVVKYMYEKWFLAGMSWLFDKAEEGLENFIDKMIVHHRESAFRSEEKARKAKGTAEKALAERVAFFDELVKEREKDLYRNRTVQIDKYKKLSADLLDYFEKPTDKKKAALQASFSDPKFIDKMKQDYDKNPEKVKKFLNRFPKKIGRVLGRKNAFRYFATKQVAVEMMDEVMRLTSAWHDKKTKEFMKNEDLKKEYDERVKERQDQLFEAAAVLYEDARLRSEMEYRTLSDDDKKKYAQTNVLEFYDRLIEKSSDEAMKQGLVEDKKAFQEWYNEDTNKGEKLPSSTCQEMIFETIADLQVQQFEQEQAVLTNQATLIQNAEREDGHYEIKGHYPEKRSLQKGEPKRSSQSLMKEAKDGVEDAIKKTKNDKKIFGEEFEKRVAEKISLFDAAVANNQPIICEGMMSEIDGRLAICQNKHEEQKKRKNLCDMFKKRLGLLEKESEGHYTKEPKGHYTKDVDYRRS